MTGFAELAPILGLLGTGVSAVGSIVAGNQAQAQAQYQAEVAEQQAEEARAVSQREAIRRAKEARMVLSRQQALAAASGGRVDDPSVFDLMKDTTAEGIYQQQSALYEGTARGAGLEAQANLYRMQGRQAQLSGFINAGSSMLSGLSSWARFRPGQMPSPYSFG